MGAQDPFQRPPGQVAGSNGLKQAGQIGIKHQGGPPQISSRHDFHHFRGIHRDVHQIVPHMFFILNGNQPEIIVPGQGRPTVFLKPSADTHFEIIERVHTMGSFSGHDQM